MTRYHATPEGPVQYTSQEEADRTAEELLDANEKPMKDWATLRMKRDALLASSDWTQYTDSPLDEAKAEWATYRQELRDLPASTEDPANPTWPEAP